MSHKEGRYIYGRGYERGVSHAQRLFAETQVFDPNVIGSRRVKIVDGELEIEQIEDTSTGPGQPFRPTPHLSSLLTVVRVAEDVESGDQPIDPTGVRQRLDGFINTYDRLLVEKHSDILGTLGEQDT